MSYSALDGSESSDNPRVAAALHETMNGIGGDGGSSAIRLSSNHSSSRHSLRGIPGASSELSEPLTSNSAADPFYVFREDLYRKLEQVDEALAEFLRIVHQTDTTANSSELKEAKKQLKRFLKSAESTLKDLSMTVMAVERDREKFPDISALELYERQSLVQTSRDRLAKAKAESQTESVKRKLVQDERSSKLNSMRRSASASSNDATYANGHLNGGGDLENQDDLNLMDAQARTTLLVRNQDETLDVLDVAVTRVGNMAQEIHEEIGQQNKMLTEMTEDLDRVEEELGMVMGKLAKFLHTKDKWQLTTILTLFLVMVVLLFLVIYT